MNNKKKFLLRAGLVSVALLTVGGGYWLGIYGSSATSSGSDAMEAPAGDLASADSYENLARIAPIQEGGGLSAEGEALVGIAITLEEGWKTYWHLPWESGLPPLLDWSDSANLREARAVWPTPTRFEDAGGMYLGYEDELILPIALRAADAGQALEAELLLRYAVCKHICIPLEERLRWHVPSGEGAADASAGETVLREALKKQPLESSPKARFVEARLVGAGGDSPSLEARVLLGEPLREHFLLAENPPPHFFGRERLLDSRSIGGETEARFALPILSEEALTSLQREGARLLFRNGDTAITASLPIRQE